ncbi:carbon storage regulator [Pseudomonas sp. LRF_L74]|uniref:carbon storage regulator n=1 Tax=Pseudomonas sp. LRF_L74 TaxID=3369422 RepID=UPI003F5EEA67
MLVLSRRECEEIHLSIAPSANAEQLLQKLARDGIIIRLGETSGSQTKVGIEAPMEILILRDEVAIRNRS